MALWKWLAGGAAAWWLLRKKNANAATAGTESAQVAATAAMTEVAKLLEARLAEAGAAVTVNVAYYGGKYEFTDAASGAVLLQATSLADAKKQIAASY
jgi:3-hydroxy-3-methylglutaryl CoA synthase